MTSGAKVCQQAHVDKVTLSVRSWNHFNALLRHVYWWPTLFLENNPFTFQIKPASTCSTIYTAAVIAKWQAFQTAQFQCILSRDSLLISYELSPMEEVRWCNRTHRSAVWKPVINQKVVVQNHIAKLWRDISENKSKKDTLTVMGKCIFLVLKLVSVKPHYGQTAKVLLLGFYRQIN